MKLQLFLAALVISLTLPTLASTALAQQLLIPFLATEGLATASNSAKDSLGSDAYLIAMASVSSTDNGIADIEFNLDNGKSSVWVYLFYSNSAQKSFTVAVVLLPFLGLQAQTIGDIGLPFDGALASELNTSTTYGNSDKLVQQLGTNASFQAYRQDLPGVLPEVVTISNFIEIDGLELPNGFPLDQPTWTVLFTGEGDSTMTCLLAANTGEAFCQRFNTSSAPSELVQSGTGMQAYPNPATGLTRIDVGLTDARPLLDGGTMKLYNSAGQEVLDLTENLTNNGFAYAAFDASTLPSGVYFCRLAGNGLNVSRGIAVNGK